MKILQFSDYIYIEPFESTFSADLQKNEDEVELEQYQSFTVEDKSKIKSYLSQKEEPTASKEVLPKVLSPEVQVEKKEPSVESVKPQESVVQVESQELVEEKETKIEEKPKEETKNEEKPKEPEMEEKLKEEKSNVELSTEPKNVKPFVEVEKKEPSVESVKPKEKVETKIESSPMTPIPELDFKKNNTGMGILEMDYFSPKKKKNEILSENLNEVVPHKSSKLSILMEENQQLKHEIEKYKKEKIKNENQTTHTSSNEVKNEEEKYSLLTLVMIAILFFFVGKLL
jgi:hypothetical protein